MAKRSIFRRIINFFRKSTQDELSKERQTREKLKEEIKAEIREDIKKEVRKEFESVAKQNMTSEQPEQEDELPQGMETIGEEETVDDYNKRGKHNKPVKESKSAYESRQENRKHPPSFDFQIEITATYAMLNPSSRTGYRSKNMYYDANDTDEFNRDLAYFEDELKNAQRIGKAPPVKKWRDREGNIVSEDQVYETLKEREDELNRESEDHD